MPEIIDLCQEIFEGMPVFKSLPQVKMEIHVSHEDWEGIANPENPTPSVHRLEMGEHTGTHVDARNHMAKEYAGHSIDKMPLSMFYTSGFCVDFRGKGLQELITKYELRSAIQSTGESLKKGDTLLICTDHYKKYFQTENWSKGPGIDAEAAEWLGQMEIAAFGVETMNPGISGVSNRQVHEICGKYNFTQYENLINLDQLIGRGRFRFIGIPLKIRGGTGSPVRAVAVFE